MTTFLLKMPVLGVDRRRFVDGGGGVGFIFNIEDFLPTAVNRNTHLKQNLKFTRK